MGNNDIEKIKADSFFEKLPELQHLDLRRNKISRIEAGAFKSAHKLTELLLSDNKLREVHNKMFIGLANIKTLWVYWKKFYEFISELKITIRKFNQWQFCYRNLTGNAITCVMTESFDNLPHLRNM